MDQAPSAFSRAVERPVLNTNWPEIACPRPIHPLPKWIDVTGWEEDEDEMTPEQDEGRSDPTPGPVDSDNDTHWEGEERFDEEDYDEEFDVPRRFLPSFILSPDPEDLPAPFFHPTPSGHALASLPPDARDLPQPRFDSDPYSPVSNVSSWSNAPGLDRPSRSSRCDSFESIVSPDPEDLPPPDFEIYDRFEVGVFEFPLDRHQDRLGETGARDRARWGFGKGLWKAMTGVGRKMSESGHRRRWLDWTRDR